MEAPKPPSIQASPSLGDSESTNTRQLKEGEPGLHSEIPGLELANDAGSPNHSYTDRLDESQDRPSGLSLRTLESNIPPEILIKGSEKVHVSPEPKDHGLLTPDFNNPEYVSRLLEQLQNKGILKEHGYKKEDPQETEITKLEPTNGVPPSRPMLAPNARNYSTDDHERRHLKPYGCTFPDCNKKFGSKNDWKRHENSQHLMLEHWICDEKQADKSSESCGRNFPRRELFKHHLSVHHRITDQEFLDRKLEACRVGRNHETRFWCGFCQEIIEITKEGIEAWTERFNHIDDHFQGRNNRAKKDINDWKGDYPPRSGSTKPQANDPEDTGITSSGIVSSSNNPSIDNNNRVGKPHARGTNQKRKRGLESEMVASKRTEIVEEMTIVICVCDIPSSLQLVV
ncbi:C2H2 type zinc finger domain protein [Daldinia childiae]|uniref:C2H2 type zinc finger domain protein n=1 Tax=Daldinia childiae TaxID=326645 RepID=UPI001444A0E9|nr:C2H2 type zinc finger domain protein [Daldinia childiae]KAF3058430.1 C2H2 type zinc finger domain protein [Daldinia childiae]